VPPNEWKTAVPAGLGKLLASLHHLVDDSGRNLVRAACDRGLQRLSEQLLAIISEDRDALLRPIEESEQRIELMKETVNEATRSMHELDTCLWRNCIGFQISSATGTSNSSVPHGSNLRRNLVKIYSS